MSFYIEVKSEAEPSVRDRFGYILEEIELIESTVIGISEQEFAGDELRQLAMERMFEIIGIASDHIPVDVKAQETKVDWQAIAMLSDRLGNALDRIEPDVLWNMANERLPPLRACAERQLQHLEN